MIQEIRILRKEIKDLSDRISKIEGQGTAGSKKNKIGTAKKNGGRND